MNDQLHLTDDEQVEQLKKWWKENGTSIVIGIVIGLSAVVGYWQWNKYQETRSLAASAQYEIFTESLASDKKDQVTAALDTLKSEYEGTTYAALAAMLTASNLVKEKDIKKAIENLKWAYEHSGHDSVQHLARIRLAKLYVADNQLTEALALIDQAKDPAFDGYYSSIKGDVYSKQGQLEKARTEYKNALASTSFSGKQREYVQMKLDDLGLGSVASSTTSDK